MVFLVGLAVSVHHLKQQANKSLQATLVNVAKIDADFMAVPRSKARARVVERA